MRFSRPTLWVIEAYLVLSAGFWMLLAAFPGWDWYQLAASDRRAEGHVVALRVIARTWNEPQRHTVVYRFPALEAGRTFYNTRQQEISPVTYAALTPGMPVQVAFWSDDPIRSNLAGNHISAYQTLNLVSMSFFFVSLWVLFRRLAPYRALSP